MNGKTARQLRQYARAVKNDPDLVEAIIHMRPKPVAMRKLKRMWQRMTHEQRSGFRRDVLLKII